MFPIRRFAETSRSMKITIPDTVLTRTRQLVECGKVVIPFPTQDLVSPVIEGWQGFYNEPIEYKNLFTVDFEKTGDPDDGYVSRDGRLRDDGVYDDRKQIFHYRPRLIKELRARAIRDQPLPDAKYNQWLLLHCSRLYFECIATLSLYARAMDTACPGFSFYDLASARRTNGIHALRLLAYDEESARGKGHIDKSFLTIHIAESHPGLRMGDERACPGEALLFFGKKAETLTSSQVKALGHEVTDERPVGDTSSRWSMVFFGHIVL